MSVVHILHIEDSEADIFLIHEAIENLTIQHTIEVAKNGVEALGYINKTGNYKDKPTPDLILLDINMPLMDGYEFLQAVKNTDSLKHIPIIMLTTSSSQEDVLKSYANYASSYIVKPDNVDEYDRIAISIRDFWLNVAQLPKHR